MTIIYQTVSLPLTILDVFEQCDIDVNCRTYKPIKHVADLQRCR